MSYQTGYAKDIHLLLGQLDHLVYQMAGNNVCGLMKTKANDCIYINLNPKV